MKLLDSFAFRFADKLLTPLVIAALLFSVLLVPFDSYEFLKDPRDYIVVHHLDPAKPNWELQYLVPNVLLFLGSFNALALILFGVRYSSNKTAAILKKMIVLAVAGLIIYGFYQAYQSGFDH